MPPGPDRLQRDQGGGDRDGLPAAVSPRPVAARAHGRAWWSWRPLAAAKVADGMALVRLLHDTGISVRPARRERAARQRPARRSTRSWPRSTRRSTRSSDALTAESVYQLVRGNPAARRGDRGRRRARRDPAAGAPVPGDAASGHRADAPAAGRPQRRRGRPAADRPARGAPGGRAERSTRGSSRWSATSRTSVSSAEFLDDEGRGAGRASRTCGSTPLGLSSTDVLYLSASSEPGLPRTWSGCSSTTSGAPRRRRSRPARASASSYGRVPETQPAELGLGELLELNAAFRSTILGARALDDRDFVHASGGDADRRGCAPSSRPAPAARWRRCSRPATPSPPSWRRPAPSRRRSGSMRCASASSISSFSGCPKPSRSPPGATSPRIATVLLAQAGAVEQEAAPPAREGPGCRGSAGAARGGLRPRLPGAPARPPRRTRRRSGRLSEPRTRCSAASRCAALSWLQGVSRVRPGASRLAAALGVRRRARAQGRARPEGRAAAVRRGRALGRVTPARGRAGSRRARSRWSCTCRARFEPAEPLAGLVIDEWVETVPVAEVTTGVAFNFDAPGARPPQAVLLAVAPPGTARWELETLEKTCSRRSSSRSCARSTRRRSAATPLLQRALPAIYVTANLAGEDALDGLLQGGELSALDHVLDADRAVLAPGGHRRGAAGARRTIRCGCSRASGRRASSRPRTPGRRCRRALRLERSPLARFRRRRERQAEGSRTGPTIPLEALVEREPVRGPATRAGISASRPRPASTSCAARALQGLRGGSAGVRRRAQARAAPRPRTIATGPARATSA